MTCACPPSSEVPPHCFAALRRHAPHARLQAGRFVYVATDVRDFIHLIDADSVWDDSPVAQ
jgi:hypothetical protein